MKPTKPGYVPVKFEWTEFGAGEYKTCIFKPQATIVVQVPREKEYIANLEMYLQSEIGFDIGTETIVPELTLKGVNFCFNAIQDAVQYNTSEDVNNVDDEDDDFDWDMENK